MNAIIKKKPDNKKKTISKANRFFSESLTEHKISATKTFFAHSLGYKTPCSAQESVENLFGSLSTGVKGDFRMKISAGPGNHWSFNLDHNYQELIIGAHALADIQLAGRGMADFHARVICSNGKLSIEDLHCKKGIFLDGRRLPPGSAIQVNERSQIKIQKYQVSFDLNGPVLPEIRNFRQADRVYQELPQDTLLSFLIKERKQLGSWTSGTTELTVNSVVTETRNVKTLRLSCPQGLLFHYHPGQYITLILRINGQQVRRSYSIASTPSRPHSLDITVKQTPGGLVSNWLCEHIKAGDKLKIKGPVGKFSCFNHKPRKLLFLAAGSGIVPIMSMLRWIVDTGAGIEVTLMLSYRTRADIIFWKELELIAAQYHNIKLHVTITGKQNDVDDWQGQNGRINTNMLTTVVPDVAERQVYLCGPDLFMQAMQEILLKQGVSKNNLHRESFLHKPTQTENKLSAQAIKEIKGQYRVIFAKSGLKVSGDGKVNLLDMAQAHGIKMDHDCRNGSCGECMVKCLSGKVDMLKDAEIEERDKQAGWVYSCCAFPKSDVVIDV